MNWVWPSRSAFEHLDSIVKRLIERAHDDASNHTSIAPPDSTGLPSRKPRVLCVQNSTADQRALLDWLDDDYDLVFVGSDIPPAVLEITAEMALNTYTNERPLSGDTQGYSRIGLVGVSGIGKTSLFRILAGLEQRRQIARSDVCIPA